MMYPWCGTCGKENNTENFDCPICIRWWEENWEENPPQAVPDDKLVKVLKKE